MINGQKKHFFCFARHTHRTGKKLSAYFHFTILKLKIYCFVNNVCNDLELDGFRLVRDAEGDYEYTAPDSDLDTRYPIGDSSLDMHNV